MSGFDFFLECHICSGLGSPFCNYKMLGSNPLAEFHGGSFLEDQPRHRANYVDKTIIQEDLSARLSDSKKSRLRGSQLELPCPSWHVLARVPGSCDPCGQQRRRWTGGGTAPAPAAETDNKLNLAEKNRKDCLVVSRSTTSYYR